MMTVMMTVMMTRAHMRMTVVANAEDLLRMNVGAQLVFGRFATVMCVAEQRS